MSSLGITAHPNFSGSIPQLFGATLERLIPSLTKLSRPAQKVILLGKSNESAEKFLHFPIQDEKNLGTALLLMFTQLH